MGRFRDFDELADAVPANEPLSVVALDLRDADGAKRLGANVRERIASQLEGQGIGFFPGPELPDWQEDPVYLYRLGSQLGTLIQAVKRPTERGLKALTAAAQSSNSTTREYDQLDEALAALNDAKSAINKVLGRDDQK
ncbi:MAG TPA: hypothetical protein VK756_02325 [Solirubrobacteraceae bacterium]|jgi:hypothetical protein|nr:hypothetical protein [Solirubrobacteraceae bacterium]